MSLFGRRRSFGFSRGMGDALARPAYLDALGQVGMLAGSLPQRRKEEQRQAEEMKILQSGDPQQIINYSLTEAARLNDPQLLAAAQQAQKRLSVQTDLGKVNSLVSLLSNPEAVNSDGVKLAGNVEARNAIYSDIRNIFAGNENLPDDGGEAFIERGTQNFATGMSRRATTLVSSNPSATADDLVQMFEQQFPGQGKYVRDAYTKSKRLEEGVIDLDKKAFRRKQLPINLGIERDITNKILSGTYNIEEVKALQEQLYQSYIDMEDGESAARVSTLVLDLQQAVADKAISDAQALETASNEAQEALHSDLMGQVFAPNAQGDFDQNYEDGLRTIQKAMKDDGLIYDSNTEAKLRELYTNQRDTMALLRSDAIEDTYDAGYVARRRPQFEEREDFLRLEARANELVSKGRKLAANNQSLTSPELAELKALNSQIAGIVLEVKNTETEAKFGKDAVTNAARRYAALFANDLTQRPDLITVEGESSFFFPDNELFFTDQPIRTLGPDGRNYYQIAQELLAEPDSSNTEAFISNIEQQLRENKTLIRDMNVDNIQSVVKSAIDDLGILDADDKRTIARIAEQQAKDDMASSLATISIMEELHTIIRKAEGIDDNLKDIKTGKSISPAYMQNLIGRAMNGTYLKVPDAYAQAVELYKTRDEREYQTRRDQLLKNAFTRGAVSLGSRNAMR